MDDIMSFGQRTYDLDMNNKASWKLFGETYKAHIESSAQLSSPLEGYFSPTLFPD